MFGYQDLIERVGRYEKVIGWYHSHPGYVRVVAWRDSARCSAAEGVLARCTSCWTAPPKQCILVTTQLGIVSPHCVSNLECVLMMLSFCVCVLLSLPLTLTFLLPVQRCCMHACRLRYGCWLSGIDVTTQKINQTYQEPFLALVVDPKRTCTSGKVSVGAFRVWPDGYTPPDSVGNDGFQTIPGE